MIQCMPVMSKCNQEDVHGSDQYLSSEANNASCEGSEYPWKTMLSHKDYIIKKKPLWRTRELLSLGHPERYAKTCNFSMKGPCGLNLCSSRGSRLWLHISSIKIPMYLWQAGVLFLWYTYVPTCLQLQWT